MLAETIQRVGSVAHVSTDPRTMAALAAALAVARSSCLPGTPELGLVYSKPEKPHSQVRQMWHTLHPPTVVWATCDLANAIEGRNPDAILRAASTAAMMAAMWAAVAAEAASNGNPDAAAGAAQEVERCVSWVERAISSVG